MGVEERQEARRVGTLPDHNTLMNKLEALADAIIAYVNSQAPDSASYQARNPMALKKYSSKHPADPTGLRVFKSWIDGYQAGLFDLEVKCAGKSRANVTSESSLQELIRAYSLPHLTSKYVAKFLRKALKDETISEKTELKYFTEKSNG